MVLIVSFQKFWEKMKKLGPFAIFIWPKSLKPQIEQSTGIYCSISGNSNWNFWLNGKYCLITKESTELEANANRNGSSINASKQQIFQDLFFSKKKNI